LNVLFHLVEKMIRYKVIRTYKYYMQQYRPGTSEISNIFPHISIFGFTRSEGCEYDHKYDASQSAFSTVEGVH